jgi:hypothetical protein
MYTRIVGIYDLFRILSVVCTKSKNNDMDKQLYDNDNVM